MADDAVSWLRANIGLAAAMLAIVGTLVGAVIAAASWFASVHHLERRVDVLRGEVNVMRATMEDNRKIVTDVRRGLEATDAALREGVARLEERIKARDHTLMTWFANPSCHWIVSLPRVSRSATWRWAALTV